LFYGRQILTEFTAIGHLLIFLAIRSSDSYQDGKNHDDIAAMLQKLRQIVNKLTILFF